ncbi:hypothetical protein SAMN05892883_1153 [Jatrophihabitans sp. GAS493]|nr:hypothetical protein SAMN05892883_1153 [Jatrophihabitans sp. GAS493]
MDLTGQCMFCSIGHAFKSATHYATKYVRKHAVALTFAAAGAAACFGSAGVACAFVVGFIAGGVGNGLQYSYNHRNDRDLGSNHWMLGLARSTGIGAIKGLITKGGGAYLKKNLLPAYRYKPRHAW